MTRNRKRNNDPVISVEDLKEEGILRMVWQDGDYVKLKLKVDKKDKESRRTATRTSKSGECKWDKMFGFGGNEASSSLLSSSSSPPSFFEFELHASAKRAAIASVEDERRLRMVIQESLDCVMPYWSAAAQEQERERWDRWHGALALRSVM